METFALTLLNPWADLIAHHGKTIENRSWSPWSNVDRLLIHAGKGWDRDAQNRYSPITGTPVTSAIVAVADLAGACSESRWIGTLHCDCDPRWAQPGQVHWQLRTIVALPEPVPADGRQQLWRPTAEVLAEVIRQYRDAKAVSAT